jgi:hypothetical protein
MELRNWSLLNHGTWSQLAGEVYGSPHYPDGTEIITSYLKVFTNGKASTKNNTYDLGQPRGLTLKPQEEDNATNRT